MLIRLKRNFKNTLLLAILLGSTHPLLAQESFRVAPYLQYGTKTSMVVLWETETPATTRIEYGESRFGDASPNLSGALELPDTRTMHEVVLEGLDTETKYFWRAVSVTESGDSLVSEPSTFRTTVQDSTAFAFLLYGDTQSNPEVWGKLAQLGWEERPNFALLAGDLVDRGGNIDDWLVEFFPPANVLMRRVPLYTALGNHEDDHENYYKYMHNPPPEYHYTFTYGNAQFFIIDTNRPVHEGSEQYIWLEEQLAKSTAPWKFVVHHHPPYSSEENDHGDSWTGSTSYGTHARNLVPLYEHYGVDFCLFGHVHMYERTWPLLDGQVNQKNGVVYINSGGAGGGLEQFAPTRSWFSAKVRSVHHYGYFMVHDNMVQFQAIDEEGRLFDSFQLNKTGERWTMSQVVKPPPPRILHDGSRFIDFSEVELETSFDGLQLRYTLDGQDPSSTSTLYSEPIRIEESQVLKVAAFTEDGRRSRVLEQPFEQIEYQDAVNVTGLQPGLAYHYYEGRWSKVPEFDQLTPVQSGTATSIGLEGTAARQEDIGLVFDGYVDIPEDGLYTFFTESDDGSLLFVNDALVVDNDGLHGARVEQGQVALREGHHKIRIEYMQGGGGLVLKAGAMLKDGNDILAQGYLYHTP